MANVAAGAPAARKPLHQGWVGPESPLRGRGFALLAKRASLVRAAELGCTTVYTRNDATNAPLLAINRRLGYRLSSLEYAWGKTLVPTSER